MDIIPYRVIRSDRRSIAIQICPDGQVVVRCGRRVSAQAVDAFVQSKSQWIERQQEKLRAAACLPVLSEAELHILVQQAGKRLPERVAFFAPAVGVDYGRVTVRKQRSRWGSCSSKGNLNFNCLLMLTPPQIQDYVVVHELCHRKEMNHSQRFWAEVARVLPDYKLYRKWLKENGAAIIGRLCSMDEK